MTDPLVAKGVVCTVKYSQKMFRNPGELDGLNCLAASKASSGDLAAMLFGVGIPYYANPRDGKSWLAIPETPFATYRVEEVHGLVFMNGQESLLAGRSDLKTTRQQIVRQTGRRSDPGKGGSFPQGGEHCELEGCGRGRMEAGRHVGRISFNTTSGRR